jgi:hypothetical protein
LTASFVPLSLFLALFLALMLTVPLQQGHRSTCKTPEQSLAPEVQHHLQGLKAGHPLDAFNLGLSLSHTLTITCTCCYDVIKGIQDKNLFSCSFSDSLSCID